MSAAQEDEKDRGVAWRRVRRRVRRFLQRRGLNSTLAVLAIVETIFGTLAVFSRTAWHLAGLSNLFCGLFIFCGFCAIACWRWWPESGSSEDKTVIEKSPDPNATPNSRDNVEAPGLTAEVPEGSHTEVPPTTSTVRVVSPSEENTKSDEDAVPEADDP
jgi:hypothetical protein